MANVQLKCSKHNMRWGLTGWSITVTREKCVGIFEGGALLSPRWKPNRPKCWIGSAWEWNWPIWWHPQQSQIIHETIRAVLRMNETCLWIHTDRRSIDIHMAEIGADCTSIVHTIGRCQYPEIIQNGGTAERNAICVIVTVLNGQQCMPWKLAEFCSPGRGYPWRGFQRLNRMKAIKKLLLRTYIDWKRSTHFANCSSAISCNET